VEPVESKPVLPPKPLAKGKTPSSLLGLKSPLVMSFRHVQGGWRNYMLYVDMAARNGDLSMARFRDCYQSLTPKDRWQHWPEQICELANVSPGELIGAVCRAIWESQAAESSLVSSMAHPQVLMQTAALAQTAEGYKDRELFFRLTGSLPDKKGTSINIFSGQNPSEGKSPLDVTPRSKLKSFDEEVIDMDRQLGAPAGAPFLVQDVSSPDNAADD
jgi:hypothetical protein